jgi:hypothetical protein
MLKRMIKKIIKNVFIITKSSYWKRKILKIPDDLFKNNEVENISSSCGIKKFGAKEKEEYEIWRKQACGIVSLKMLADYFKQTKKKTIYQMVKEGMKFGTFIVPEKVEKPEDIKGIFHEGLLEYAKTLGFTGFAENLLPTEKVIYFVSKGWYFLASVNIYDLWGKKWKNKFSHKGEGKHIILIVGFKKKKGKITKIYYKDCSTECKWNKETDEVDYTKFRDNFNNRGVFLKA